MSEAEVAKQIMELKQLVKNIINMLRFISFMVGGIFGSVIAHYIAGK